MDKKKNIIALIVLVVFVGILIVKKVPLTSGWGEWNNNATATKPVFDSDLPYFPPNFKQGDVMEIPPPKYVGTWISSTNTPVTFSDFSFILPAGWKGEAYESYDGQETIRIQKETEPSGFISIECPPTGKGLEGVRRTSVGERQLNSNGVNYTVSLEKLVSSENPSFFIWIKKESSESYDIACFGHGGSGSGAEKAMYQIYKTLK